MKLELDYDDFCRYLAVELRNMKPNVLAEVGRIITDREVTYLGDDMFELEAQETQ